MTDDLKSAAEADLWAAFEAGHFAWPTHEAPNRRAIFETWLAGRPAPPLQSTEKAIRASEADVLNQELRENYGAAFQVAPDDDWRNAIRKLVDGVRYGQQIQRLGPAPLAKGAPRDK